MSESNGLPEGWAEATLGALLHRIEGGTSFKCLTRMAGRQEWGVIKVSAMTWGSFLEDEQKALPPKTIFDPVAEIKPGDLLISRCNTVELVGASVLVGACRPRLLLSDKSLRLVVAEAIDRKWLQKIMSSQIVRQQMSDVATGSSNSMRNISQDKIKAVRFPLPPLREQHRIVEKIEELFSDLDAGVASLERAKANLKRYRASVLKSAVEGRLTKEWRKEHPQAEDGQMLLDRILRERREKWEKDQLLKFKEKGKEPPKGWESKYEEPSAPDTSELPELPEGWAWATVDQVTDNHDGHRVPLKSEVRDTRAGQYPYYGASGIIDDIDDYLFDGEYLLIAEDGANLLSRSTPIAFMATGRFWVNNHAHVVQAWGGVPLRYLSVFLNATNLALCITGTAQPKLTQASLNKICLPLPPLAEQEQIVALVEERLSQIDSAEKTIDAELIRSKRLRQSILKRAFEGKLVPQDPKDEPASVLLERIKASREAEQPKKKSKKARGD